MFTLHKLIKTKKRKSSFVSGATLAVNAAHVTRLFHSISLNKMMMFSSLPPVLRPKDERKEKTFILASH